MDLDDRQVTINQQIVSVAHELFDADPKADSERTIDLDSESARLFDLRQARQAEARARMGEAWVDTGLVFTREDGTGYHPDYLTKLFKRLVDLADLPPLTLHGLRHGAACIAHAGAPLQRRFRSSLATAASRSRWTSIPTCSRSTDEPRPKPLCQWSLAPRGPFYPNLRPLPLHRPR
ncbi:hypothetical protein ATKI12_7264 [Kitasatospora sp. Ki12]